MALKDNAQDCIIKEQIIEDLVSELTFQFERTSNGWTYLRVFGKSLEFGNRDIVFNDKGELDGFGTHVSGLCKPTWRTEIEGD